MPGQAHLLRGDDLSVFFKRRGPVPVFSKMLSDYAEGDIILLNESGSPVEFYVAKHDYESGLNGTGRTLLVRKDCYDIRVWHSSDVNAYATSAIDTWLNGTYKALLDSDVKEAIGTTKFYYTTGNGNTTITTLERSIFLLSLKELEKSYTYANAEGTSLPISSTLQIAYLNGSAVAQWTRSVQTTGTLRAIYLDTGGGVVAYGCSQKENGSRPVFTLPGTSLFNPDTNEFISAE